MSQMPYPPAYPETQPQMAPPKSSRSCAGLGLGCGIAAIVVGLLSCAGILVVPVVIAFSMLRSSETYQLPIKVANASPEVEKVLGNPVEGGFPTNSNISFDNDHGNAELTFSVSGPDGSGTMHVEATRDDGEWHYDKVKLKTSQGTIDLTQQCNEHVD